MTEQRTQAVRADAAPAWRPLPAGLRIERVCCLKYRRVVANDHTVRAGATILQLPPGPGRRGYAGRRVELELRLDGRLVVWDGERDLVTIAAPADPVELRVLEPARGDIGTPPPSAATASPDHPWRQVRAGTALNERKRQERLTGSLTR